MASSTLPRELTEIFSIGFEFEFNDETGETTGFDFEPYEQFEDPEETTDWFRSWTGNDDTEGGKLFRMFGSSGAGDYAGFWLIRPNVKVTEQPVVYMSSEGEHGLIARDVGDLLWIFANGCGPHEAFETPEEHKAEENKAFAAIAQRYAPDRKRSTAEIVAAAQKEFPDFGDMIEGLIR